MQGAVRIAPKMDDETTPRWPAACWGLAMIRGVHYQRDLAMVLVSSIESQGFRNELL